MSARQVQRHEIFDYQTYEETRSAFQQEVFAAKALRRIHVGEHFTFLFENTVTIRYQVQEMMRAEKIVREKDIEHELKTYNGVLGGEGELGCTLLIEIDDPDERAVKLREWLKLPEHIYAVLPDGRRVRPSFDEGQRGRERVSSVQYLKFTVGRVAPTAIGVDLQGIETEAVLSDFQRAALEQDLA